MTKIKFNNGFEIAVEHFNSNINVENNRGTINFNVTYDKRADIEANATKENMNTITVTREKDTALFEGFNNNITVMDNISDLQWVVTVTATK